MDLEAITALSNRLQGLYGARFPGLTPAMVTLWQEELRAFTPAILESAVREWLRGNTFRAPGLQDLIPLAHDVTDEQEEAERRTRASQRAATHTTPGDVLQEAAAKEGSKWARLHIALFTKGVTVPGRYDEAAAMCEEFATQHPDDAKDWRAEAAWWRSGAHGKPSFERDPGEEG